MEVVESVVQDKEGVTVEEVGEEEEGEKEEGEFFQRIIRAYIKTLIFQR